MSGHQVPATECPPALSPEAQAAHDALHGIEHCGNCGDPIQLSKGLHLDADDIANSHYFGHRLDVCALVMLISVVHDRGDTSQERLFKLMAKCDPDRLWSDLGEVVDKLEHGGYGE